MCQEQGRQVGESAGEWQVLEEAYPGLFQVQAKRWGEVEDRNLHVNMVIHLINTTQKISDQRRLPFTAAPGW